MITPEDLQEAISTCLTAPRPNASTCMMLAAFYIIQERLPASGCSDSEFMQAIKGKSVKKVLEIVDETLTVLQSVNPNLYDKTIERIHNI